MRTAWQAGRCSKGMCVRLSCAALSLALDLEPVRADIDLQAFRLFLGLIQVVAEHGDRNRQRANDEIEKVTVGHPMLRLCKKPFKKAAPMRFSQCRCAPAILKGEANDLRAL